MFDRDNSTCKKQEALLFFQNKGRVNSNDQYVVYLELYPLSLSYKTIIVCPKAVVKSQEAYWIP